MTTTEVLIVGGGPTGLMMACQLHRFGIQFRIIDKLSDRAHESRAFAIQARTMEIFQNLGIAPEFLQAVRPTGKISFFVNGKKRVDIVTKNLGFDDTPFPSLFFLAQSETERLLSAHLQKSDLLVERNVELLSVAEKNGLVSAEIRNSRTGKIETVVSQYVIGCDGAHSKVREEMGIPFGGATYNQEFILADAAVKWPFSQTDFMIFFGKKGIFLYAPLTKSFSRAMGGRFNESPSNKRGPVTKEEVEKLGREVTGTPFKLENPLWLSRFKLHHRVVKEYRKGQAFLAGDSAHIHTPVGGQGMNTGLQDVTNLAWKLALVLKGISNPSLLDTYQSERQRVGEILVKTTDRAFGLISASGFISTTLKNIFIPLLLPVIWKVPQIRKKIFRFMSQLNIKYHESAYVTEISEGADPSFSNGPRAGFRAPDGAVNSSTLFELMKGGFFSLLFFGFTPASEFVSNEMVRIHIFETSPSNRDLFRRYGVSSMAIYLVRPDGYIGFRSYGSGTNALTQYLGNFKKLAP